MGGIGIRLDLARLRGAPVKSREKFIVINRLIPPKEVRAVREKSRFIDNNKKAEKRRK